MQLSPRLMTNKQQIALAIYLQEDVCGVMHTHDQGSHPQHVVSVGERDERDGGEMVDQHNVEILTEVKAKKQKRIKSVQ
jgi:dolichyl-phosphate-mannose--protein O-mannosyl transferase